MRVEAVESIVLKIAADDVYLGPLQSGAALGAGYALRPPYRSLYSSRYETMLVRITAEDGTSGWGEALAPVAPEVPAAIVDRLLAPALQGIDATRPRPAWSRLRDLMRERGHLVGHQADALAAVDIALWDLAGRLAGRSIADLLGGAFRTEVPTYVSGLPRPTDPERAELAREWAAQGARAVKLHLGNGIDADLATIHAVHAAAPSLRIAVDAHWTYTVEEALQLGQALAELTNRRGWFVEAPLAPEDVNGHAELVHRCTVPVAVGEALRNRYEFTQWLDARAVRIAQPDVARTGITEALAISELCAVRHVPLAPHHSVGLGVSLAAGLHVAAVCAELAAFEYQPASTQVGARVLARPLIVRPDGFSLHDAPGLGIDIDTDAVYRLAKES